MAYGDDGVTVLRAVTAAAAGILGTMENES